MSFKLIPTEERHRYQCCVCGTTKSVKYLIPTHNPLEGEGFHDMAYCNRCALLLSQLTEKITQQND